MRPTGRAPLVEAALPSLRRNISWTFAGNLVYVLCQWGMLTVLAKLGNPQMVGQFALGLAVTAPVVLFANLSLRQVQATDARRQYAFGDYLGLRLLTTALAFLVIVGVAFVGYRPETALVVLAVGLAKSFEAVSDAFYGLLQQRERMDRIARSMMIKGVLSLAALGVTVYATGSVFWGAVGLAAAWAAVLLLYDARSGALLLPGKPLPSEDSPARPRPRWDGRTLAGLAYLALPLGVVAGLISLNANVPRYLLEHHLGEREVGIFSAMAYIMVASGVVVNAVGQSASPRLARHYADGERKAFSGLLVKLCAVGALAGAAGVTVAAVAGGPILSLLYTPEYAAYAGAFVWMMAAAGISYVASFLGFGLTAARRFRVQVPLFIGVVFTTVVACAILVPILGILGAALGVLAGMISQLIYECAILAYDVVNGRR